MARQRVADMAFMPQYQDVREHLEAVNEMLGILQAAEGQPLPLGEVYDMSETLSAIRVQGTAVEPEELPRLRSTIDTIGRVASFFGTTRQDDRTTRRWPRLYYICDTLEPMPQLLRLIDGVVDQYGNIRDNASPELRDIRQQLQRTQGSLQGAMRSVIARAAKEGYVDNDVTPSMRDGRLVLPVAPMYKRRIGGIVHDASATGKTLFIEPPELVEANNRIRELQLAERQEIHRILVTVADELRPWLETLLDSVDILGHLDFVRAKARYAIEIGACLPSLHDGPELEWYHACHPVLEASLKAQGREIVPLNISLTPHDRILVISGPNAGGKSVTLKTVGIIQYMVQCGLLPPLYDNSHIGVFDELFIDIGDDQSLQDDLSTYSSHLRNMRYLLSHAGPSTLMLIDEMGSGTEPQAGAAIAQAVLEQINAQGAWGIITTHYVNLKQLANSTSGLVNGSMQYDRQRMTPLFTLTIGQAGSSFALEIARKTGLSRDVVTRAEEIAGSDYVNTDRYLLDIARDRRYWENKRRDIQAKNKKIEAALERHEAEADGLRAQRRQILDEARAEARKILDGSNALIERTIQEIRHSQAERLATLEARQQLNRERQELTEDHSEQSVPAVLKPKRPKRRKTASKPLNEPIGVDSWVKLDGQGTSGRVIEVSGSKARVIFGQMTTTVALDRLTAVSHNAKEATPSVKVSYIGAATSNADRERQLSFNPEIDVRGMRADEATQAVTYYIDDAIRFSASRVRILHGTGTGALRQCLRQYLQTVPQVASAHDEDVRMGGAGITVVDLQ